MVRVFRLLDRILSKSEEIFISITLLVISVVVFVNVIMRYGFSASTMWTEELTRYTIIFVTFVGSSLCVRESYHPRVEALVMRIPGNIRWIITPAVLILGIIFSVILVIYGSQLIGNALTTAQRTPTGLAPMYLPYIAIPVGGALMTLRYCQLTVKELRKLSWARKNTD